MRSAHCHWIIVLWLLAASGCGGPRRVGPQAPPLASGEAVYELRYNPSKCLHNTPELQVEVRVAGGWESVALVHTDDTLDLATQLLERFAAAPERTVRILGTLSDRAEPFGVGHVARSLTIDTLDPPPDSDE